MAEPILVAKNGEVECHLLRGLPEPESAACPVAFWDVFGLQGHPVRATISDLGPLLLARMLALNETQSGVLSLVFKVAADAGLALLDLKDLRALLQHVGDNARQFTTEYGNVSPASIGAIQRGLLQLEEQGGEGGEQRRAQHRLGRRAPDRPRRARLDLWRRYAPLALISPPRKETPHDRFSNHRVRSLHSAARRDVRL